MRWPITSRSAGEAAWYPRRRDSQRKVAALGPGTRTVRLPLSKAVRSDRATLQIVARDSAEKRKVLSKIVNVPAG